MEAGDRMEVQRYLSTFKPNGKLELIKTMEIPTKDRITALVAQHGGFLRVAAVLVASLKSAMENLNLKNPLSEDQIVDLAAEIIDEAESDNLSIEDVLLFLGQMVTGKAGTIYDRMDFPTFFTMFNKYRDARHAALVEFRENEHLRYKSLGDPTRSVTPSTAFEEHLAAFSSKLSNMKDELHEAKQELKRKR